MALTKARFLWAFNELQGLVPGECVISTTAATTTVAAASSNFAPAWMCVETQLLLSYLWWSLSLASNFLCTYTLSGSVVDCGLTKVEKIQFLPFGVFTV